nr:hypothetical protein [Tanacetum cinerariifolium]
MNKLVKGNLVRGLPLKILKNDHTCVACQKGKQHKATCKDKLVSSINQPLHMFHMDLFGLTFVISINYKKYCLVVTDDFSRFSWVFFLGTKDETSKILKPFITAIENQINKKVKVNRCNNGSEFKNRDLDEFCGMKGIKKEYSNAKTSQQNKVTERKNRTLIEAARTMLADSLLPITFWAEAVNTAYYVLNRALVTKSHNKTPYELLNGKFKGKADEGFLVGYSVTNKSFQVSVGNQTDKNAGPQDTNGNVGTQDNVDAVKEVSDQHYMVLSLWSFISSTFKSSDDKAADDKPKDDTGLKTVEEPVNKEDQAYRDELDRLMIQEKRASDAADALTKEFEQGCMDQRRATKAGITNSFNTVSNPVNATIQSMGAEADFNNMESFTIVSHIPTHRVHVDHLKDQILGDPKSSVQTKGTTKKSSRAHAFVSYIHKQRIDLPYGNKAIGTKWVYRNKKDERGIIVMNKARMVAPGHKKEEGIDYDEVFAPVARIEAIRIFLAFASFMGLIVYQIDVKRAFLCGIIEEEVYVSQPPCFIDPQFPNKVYVDDIIFRSTKKSLCDEFEALMHKRYQMSSMEELTFFLGLQVKQSEEEIFISQDKFQVTLKLSHLHAVKRIFSARSRILLLHLLLKHSMFLLLTAVDSLVWAATTASLDAQQDSSNITKTQFKATLNEPTPQKEGSSSGPGRQETMGGYTVGSEEDKMEHGIELTDHVLQTPYDSPLSGGHIPRSDEGSMTLKELMDLYTTLQQKVLDLENVKTAQAMKIASLNKRVTKLEQRQGSRILGFYPFRASTSKRHSLGRRKIRVMVKKGSTAETVSIARPDICATRPEVSTAEPKTPPTTATLFDDKDVTIANTLVKMKNRKAKEKGIAFKDADDSARPIRSITTLQPILTIDPNDKSKGILQEHELVKKAKKMFEGDKEHRKCLKVVPDDDKAIDYETLDVKSLIVDFLDRQDVLYLHKIIMERFPANDLEGYDLILWGDLKTLVESSEDDEIWRNQQD